MKALIVDASLLVSCPALARKNTNPRCSLWL
jgi:hypothetical protein